MIASQRDPGGPGPEVRGYDHHGLRGEGGRLLQRHDPDRGPGQALGRDAQGLRHRTAGPDHVRGRPDGRQGLGSPGKRIPLREQDGRVLWAHRRRLPEEEEVRLDPGGSADREKARL